MKYHSGNKKSGGSWTDIPFTIGREGAEFMPSTFGDDHGTEKKSIPNDLHEGEMEAMACGSMSKSKKMPMKKKHSKMMKER